MINFFKHIQPERWISIALTVAILSVFSPVIGHDFIDFDDGVYIVNNPHVRTGFALENIRWAFTTLEASNWHPITWLSHMLDSELYGLYPAGHHLTSVFFHLANTLLLFLFLRRSTSRLWESAMVAVLFGLHPLHVESVAWISERKDVLSGFFFLLTLLAYIEYVKKPDWFRYLSVIVACGLGLMTKPMVVTLPFVLLLLDFWPLNRMNGFQRPLSKTAMNPKNTTFRAQGTRRSFSYLVFEKLPLFFLSAASCVITVVAQARGETVLSLTAISLFSRIMNGGIAYVTYLWKIVWPWRLSIFCPYPVDSLPFWQAIGALLVIITISLYAIRSRNDYPYLLVGWFWFLGMLVPVIGIVQVGVQAMADRYTYLPSIGIFISLVWISTRWFSFLSISKLMRISVTALVLIGLIAVTWKQLAHWKNTETLFRHALSVTRQNHVAHCILGNALLKRDDLESATAEYNKALAIWPDYPDAHNNLGLVFARQGDMGKAMFHYSKALQTDPNHILAHLNMATALAGLGQDDDAISHYETILARYPNKGAAHNGLGVVLAKSGSLEKAIVHLNEAIALCRDCPEPLNNIGRIFILKGGFNEAVIPLQKAIALRSDFPEAYNNLGIAYLKQGQLNKARICFSTAIRQHPDYEKARINFENLNAFFATIDEE